MQIEIMRHHGRADDTEREIEHFGISDDVDRRRKAADDGTPLRIGKGNLDGEAHRDDAEHRDDEGFEIAEAKALQQQHDENVERGQQHADLERNAKKQIEADRRTDDFGDVGRDDRGFGEKPKRIGGPLRIAVAAGLRQIAAGSDREAGAERLQDDRHNV